jgi:glycosyltransferase involved in cell wall biosynthesis
MPEQRGALKVTHVVLSMDVGGMERNVVNQVREGRKLGQEVSILCLERRGTLAERAESLGARVVCVDKPDGFRPGIVRPIRAVLRDLAPDVVHTHQIGPLFYTGLAAARLSVPLLVHTEHGKVNYAARRRTRWLGRVAAGFARRFYCLSRDMVDHVTAARIVPGHKLHVIQNGIDTSFYLQPRDGGQVRRSLGIPPDAPLVGTVGRLTEVKRQDVLIDAFAEVVRRIPSARLLLVGGGPLHEALRQRAATLGLAQRVHFTGYQTDTTPYLYAMDVFTLTSRSEGMPQALLEACVAARPVVATRVGGIPEVIEQGETGLLVPPGEVLPLADALCEVIDHRECAAAMGRRASQRVVARFDISRMAQEYHRDFFEMLNGRRVGGADGTAAADVAGMPDPTA